MDGEDYVGSWWNWRRSFIKADHVTAKREHVQKGGEPEEERSKNETKKKARGTCHFAR